MQPLAVSIWHMSDNASRAHTVTTRRQTMNIILWILQILLAVHNAMGAVWKFFNSEQTVPSLGAIPHSVWLALSVFEVLCCLGLILPALNKALVILVPISAACFVAEMVVFSGINIFSGVPNYGQMIYWLVVAAISAFIAYGRFVLRPL